MISRIAATMFTLAGAAGFLHAVPGDSNGASDPPGTGTMWFTPVIEFNDRLPSWIRVDGRYRSRVELIKGIGFRPISDNHDLSQFRLRLTIQPTDWLQFVGETQDARIFGNRHVSASPPYQNTWDIRQAYVQLHHPRDGWFDIIVGRKSLSFGEERLIGPADWLNQGRTFDVARIDLHHRRAGVSLFASSVVIARDGVIDHHLEGNNLYGAYGSLKAISKTTIEPYTLWRVAPGNVRLSENAGRGGLSEVTIGARIQGTVPGSLEFAVEIAKQTGTLGLDPISSWAGHWKIARPLNMRPKLGPFVEANYASGTKDPAGGRWNTFDQIYPSNHDKLGFADQVGWRNIKQVRGGVSEPLGKKWTFTETYENFWLASGRDALYASSGAIIAQAFDGTAGRHVGQEVDVWAEWDWRKVIELGFGYARFLAGAYLTRTTPGKDFNFPFAYLTYHFTQEKTN